MKLVSEPSPLYELTEPEMAMSSGLLSSTPSPKSVMEAMTVPEARRRPPPRVTALLLVTLSEQGMLLGQRGVKPVVIPTVAQEVYDVSGAGDTVIASFTLAIAAGASPLEAAIFSNHAAGVVVGKIGTATVTPQEILGSFA